MLAGRLAESNQKKVRLPDPLPRTIAIIPAGQQKLPDGFCELLCDRLSGTGSVRLVDSNHLGPDAQERSSKSNLKQWLNQLETEHDFIAYKSDETLTEWSRQALRQQVCAVVAGIEAAGVCCGGGH